MWNKTLFLWLLFYDHAICYLVSEIQCSNKLSVVNFIAIDITNQHMHTIHTYFRPSVCMNVRIWLLARWALFAPRRTCFLLAAKQPLQTPLFVCWSVIKVTKRLSTPGKCYLDPPPFPLLLIGALILHIISKTTIKEGGIELNWKE